MDRYSIKISQAGKEYVLPCDEATADEIVLSRDGRIGYRSMEGHRHSFAPGTWDAAEITLLEKNLPNCEDQALARRVKKMKEMLAALARRDKAFAR